MMASVHMMNAVSSCETHGDCCLGGQRYQTRAREGLDGLSESAMGKTALAGDLLRQL